LRILNLTEEDVTQCRSKVDFLSKLTDIQKNNLAYGEHLRWNAFHFSNGWTTLAENDLPDYPKYKDRQNEKIKKHACLVGWDDLEKLGTILDKDLKNLDMVTVENIYDFISDN